jgi:hypothetical protein
MSGFIVPSDDVRWCAALATALSVCCAAPVSDRVAEVRALIASPPVQMLPVMWHALIGAAEKWLGQCDAAKPGDLLPQFAAIRLIEMALRDKPVPVPAWAERCA